MRVPFQPLALACLLALGAGPALGQAPAPQPASTPAAPVQPGLTLTIDHLFDAPPASVPPIASPPTLASASAEVQRVARWIADSHDNSNLPYLLVDKVNATVYAFARDGRLLASAPALLGMTPGDKLKVSNETQMAQMTADDRVTPAGRFLSRLSVDSHDKELLVLDYDAGISMHPVVKGTPEEHRAERLASPTSADNRISYGCINVPPAFYDTVVSPSFTHTKGIVYVLPETSTAGNLFGFVPYDAPPATAMNADTAGTPEVH